MQEQHGLSPTQIVMAILACWVLLAVAVERTARAVVTIRELVGGK